MKKLLAAAAFVALLMPALRASAASPIVGLWSMIVHDSSGQAFAVVWDEFDANGKLMVRFVTKAGTETYYGTYRMLSPTKVESIFTDYEPKVLCTLVCSRITPVFPMNRTSTSPVRFAGPYLYLGADRYNRQR